MNNNIIEYRPNLELNKKLYAPTYNTDINESNLFTPSETIKNLKDNLPSTIINKLDEIIDNCKNTKDKLDSKLSNVINNGITFDLYKQAILDDDLDIIDLFEEDNEKNINGMLDLELYYPLIKVYEDLKDFNGFYKMQNYGDAKNINYEITDKNNLDKIIDNEKNNIENESNYTAMTFDILSNEAVNTYLNNLNSLINIIKTSINDNEMYIEQTNIKKHDNIDKLFNIMFDDKKNINSQDKVKLRQLINGDSKCNVINKVYQKRSDLITLLSDLDYVEILPNSLFKNNIVNSLKLLYNEISTIIINMHKVFNREIVYLNDYISSLIDKQSIRNQYITYNK